MSLLDTPTDLSLTSGPDHPLDRLSAGEIDATRELLADTLTPTTRFAYLGLLEPPKAEVLAFSPGDPISRTVRALLLDTATGVGRDVRVSLSEHRVLSDHTVDGPTQGHVPILEEEFAAIDPIVAADERWVAALAARGLTVSDVVTVPLSAGHYDDIPATDPGASRIMRVFAFQQPDAQALPWAHPVDGVVAYVDLSAQKVLHVLDHQRFTVPQQTGNWNEAPFRPRSSAH